MKTSNKYIIAELQNIFTAIVDNDLTHENCSIMFPEDLLRRFSIYGWKQESQWLYIGCSSFPETRIHAHIKENKIITKDCILFIWELPIGCTKNDMLLLEAELINHLKPKHNVQRKTLKQSKCLSFENSLFSNLLK